jgi:hypothetical protein
MQALPLTSLLDIKRDPSMRIPHSLELAATLQIPSFPLDSNSILAVIIVSITLRAQNG